MIEDIDLTILILPNNCLGYIIKDDLHLVLRQSKRRDRPVFLILGDSELFQFFFRDFQLQQDIQHGIEKLNSESNAGKQTEFRQTVRFLMQEQNNDNEQSTGQNACDPTVVYQGKGLNTQ